ncbi:AAA family ATPase [bacterium (Candidatus Gribaldobacteria) CG08_land_8_20_14_0_20_39_15]|uniref:AAA family ATPase n=1 Tax=bacterium (Candidatus Gribaldobacteria) CG08_land_8_20_14_0_20_39_15 TaxID=2014273 RepID=A0A2M6XUM3_9BACT|nr:MAG: AAA family ATPase [bacterium (Candidatus Gribaldobacteria) CG08_land_8_20_14_0_20_39_15]
MTQEQAIEILKTGANVFLTGEPGSGKTYIVNQYADYLRASNIQTAITASTGIAATHLNGLTIHSWSGIGIKEKLSRNDLEKITNSRYITNRVAKANVLIIDEISMLEAGTFALVDLVCQKIRGSGKPFGGLQIVAVGDFFQLPPISKNGKNSQFAFQSNVWEKTNFVVCYLTEQYRQDDQEFLTILSAIRANGFTASHLQSIQTRIIELAQSPKDITRIFSHNVDVDAINSQELAGLPGKAKVFYMFSRGRESFVANLKKGCLSPEVLELKIGACVMFTKNNVKEGFVNGTIGKVVGFNQETAYPVVQITNGEQVEVWPMEWTVEENGSIKARITQIPLRLAWAITIHKSQGMSLDCAVMDLQKTFEFGQGYVALSRVRRLSGLYLLGYNRQAFLTHPDMQNQDQIFRSQSQQAQASFALIPKEQIVQQQNNFLAACGGSLTQKSPSKKGLTIKKEKISTYEKTLFLIKQGKSILDIAAERGIVQGTVITHLENLVLREKVNYEELKRLIGNDLLLNIPEICQAFRGLNTDKLQSIFEKLNGKYSYNEIRLARLIMAFD